MTEGSAFFGAGWAGHLESKPPSYKGNGSALRRELNVAKTWLGAVPIWGMSVRKLLSRVAHRIRNWLDQEPG